ncbi:MAG: Crp/Fnr family transcriptional regulator [Anaerolineae bacterium]|nr:Crp/Fnr family transcriptional regulator [Anaerolineae bacterium]
MSTVDHFKNSKDFQTFTAGQVIFETGAPGGQMYAVKDGEVDIIYRDTVLDTVGPGGIFGEMGLVEGNASRSATAIARTDCQIVPVDKQRFLFLVHETPTFALSVMQIMAHRLRRMNELI